jgi:hypothetical protein
MENSRVRNIPWKRPKIWDAKTDKIGFENSKQPSGFGPGLNAQDLGSGFQVETPVEVQRQP